MNVTRTRKTWREMANVVAICIVFFLLFAAAHAGGLGIAPITAAGGVIGLLTVVKLRPRAIPVWGWSLAVFLIWAVASSLWSPYDDPHTLSNPVKLIVGAALFLSIDPAVKAASEASPNGIRRVVVVCFGLALAALLFDIFSGYKLTYLLDPPGEQEVLFYKNGDILRNLGHAVVVLSLILSFVIGMIKGTQTVRNVLITILTLLVFLAAWKHKLAVANFAIIAAILGMVAARFWPRSTITGLTGIAILSVLAAPAFGYISRLIGPNIKASLPISWEHRLAIWEYVTARIMEAPLLGHGFDAARTFDDMITMRNGVELSLIALHPHNAGLHIWLETGLIGAGLASLTLLLLGVAGLKAINKRPEWAVPLAGFAAATIIISTVTYGVWQDWWWAALILILSARYLIPVKA